MSMYKLLMIGPKNTVEAEPVVDTLTIKMQKLLKLAETGHPYKGTHKCVCGERSSNTDHIINIGHDTYITNNLAVHYLTWHRSEVPIEEIIKLKNINI